MKRFLKQGQRVIVIDKESPVCGETGKVQRIRMADNGAWIRMDRELPPDLQSFPAGDDRHNDIVLYPDQCEMEGLTDADPGRRSWSQ